MSMFGMEESAATPLTFMFPLVRSQRIKAGPVPPEAKCKLPDKKASLADEPLPKVAQLTLVLFNPACFRCFCTSSLRFITES